MVVHLSSAENKLQLLMQEEAYAQLQQAMSASFRERPLDLAGLKACLDPSQDSPEDMAHAQVLFAKLEERCHRSDSRITMVVQTRQKWKKL